MIAEETGSCSGIRRIFSEFSLSKIEENEFDIIECVVDGAINTVSMIYRYDKDYPAIRFIIPFVFQETSVPLYSLCRVLKSM